MERENITANYLKSKRGASMLEYALLAALVGVAVIGSVTAVGQKVEETFQEVGDQLGAGGFDDRAGG